MAVPQGYKLEFSDEFDGPELDGSKWLPHYLPHWSSREQSAARYRFAGGQLVLRIDQDQQPWCPEWDTDNRTSTLQTAEFAGPVGGRIGQSRFHEDLVVREEQQNQQLYLMHHGYIELRMKASADPDAMVALWMMGHEDVPEHCGEILLTEIFGNELTTERGLVGMGVRPYADAVTDGFEKVPVELDLTEFHVYAAHWTPGHVDLFIDDELVKSVDEAPDYPLQLMLGVFVRPTAAGGPYPKEFVVDYVRIYTAP